MQTLMSVLGLSTGHADDPVVAQYRGRWLQFISKMIQQLSHPARDPLAAGDSDEFFCRKTYLRAGSGGGAPWEILERGAFVHDASYFGIAGVALVGNRQNGRETAEHAHAHVAVEGPTICDAIRRQLAHGRYPPSCRGFLDGDGHASERIAAALERLTLYQQKCLGYVTQL